MMNNEIKDSIRTIEECIAVDDLCFSKDSTTIKNALSALKTIEWIEKNIISIESIDSSDKKDWGEDYLKEVTSEMLIRNAIRNLILEKFNSFKEDK